MERNDEEETEDDSFAKPIDREIAGCVLGRAPITFRILLMTGSVYEFTVRYGEVDTPSSLLPLLYGRLVGGADELKRITGLEGFQGKDNSQESWVHWLLKQFRGLSFYTLDNENHSDANGTRMSKFPVQVDEDNAIGWTSDILWEPLNKRVESMREQLFKAQTESSEDIETIMNKIDSQNCITLVLRRSTAMSSEKLAGQVELFNDQVSERDIVNLRQFWVDYLTLEKMLPVDHVRVDLLFAEETRCVNAKLYGGASDSMTYLVALQLALSWVDVDSHEWLEDDDGCIGGVDVSVRPIMRMLVDPVVKKARSAQRVSGRNVTSRVSAYFRRSLPGGEEFSRIGKMLKRKMRLKSIVDNSVEEVKDIDQESPNVTDTAAEETGQDKKSESSSESDVSDIELEIE